MSRAYVHTNVILRFLTGDPPDLAAQARALFDAVERGEVTLVAGEIVIAEVVWVQGVGEIFSFDRHFDCLPGIIRQSPGE